MERDKRGVRGEGGERGGDLIHRAWRLMPGLVA
jgi:hypothetical protein